MFLLLLLLALPVCAETVQLVRDAYGVPHVFAKTIPGAAFGVGYAQAEDRPNALIANLHAALEPGELPDKLRPMVEAYVAGVNQALEAQSRTERIQPDQVASFARRAFRWILGSNDLMMGPTRTNTRSVIAVLAPVSDWSAPDRPYEMSLYASDGEFAMSGVAPVGLPFPVVGFSERVAIGWSGSRQLGGPKSLEQAWSLINARNLSDAQRALAMKQIQGDALIGTAAGDIYDSSGAQPTKGYLRRAGPSPNGDADAIEQLRVQTTWSFGRVEDLALSTEVYKADSWQRYLARIAPENRFVRRITGWNRRAEPESKEALAFYVFKRELERDASAIEPPDSISSTRLRAALQRAQDVIETKLDFNANWGTIFRSTREGSRESAGVGGGTLPDVGIFTPRTLNYTAATSGDPAALRLVTSGQSATIVVELSRKIMATSLLLPGESDDPASPYFDDQARRTTPKRTFFGDRRSLDRAVSSRKELIF